MSDMTKETKKNPNLKIVRPETEDCGDPNEIPVGDVKQAPPSTIYEAIMRTMNAEQFAVMGVQMVQINGEQLFWMTSTGQLFPFNAKLKAVEAEYAWLMSRPATNDSNS